MQVSIGIIGAGPAGSSWAKKLSELENCSVTVYEKRNLISNYNQGLPRNLRGVIGKYTSELFARDSLPYDTEIKKALLTSKLGVILKISSQEFGYNQYGYIVSDSDLNRKLAIDAIDRGAHIVDGTKVIDIKKSSDLKMMVEYENDRGLKEAKHDFVIYSGDYKAPYLDKYFGSSKNSRSYTIVEIETKGNIRNSEFGDFETVFEPRSPFGYDTAALFGKDDVISFQCVAPTRILPTVEHAKRAMKKEMPRMSKKYGIEYGDIHYENGAYLSTDTRGSVVADGIIKAGATSAGLQSRITATGISQSMWLVDGTLDIISDSIREGNFSKKRLWKYQNLLDKQRKIYGRQEKVQGVMMTPGIIDLSFVLGNKIGSIRNMIANRMAFEKSYIQKIIKNI